MLFFRLTPHALRDESDHALRCAGVPWAGRATRRACSCNPQHSHRRLSPSGFHRCHDRPLRIVGFTAEVRAASPCPAPLHAIAATLTVNPALPRIGGFLSTGRSCPAHVAPMSRREARRPDGPGSRARRAERQSSTARRALRWSRPVFLLTLTVVAGGCATMGCALSEHHTLHSAPHLRREFRPTKFTLARRRGQDSKKSTESLRCTARYAGSVFK